MTTYEFTIVLAGVDDLTPAMANTLIEAGCDDATLSYSAGVVSLNFDRKADSLWEAVGSAIKEVKLAGYKVARVVFPDGGA